jgi:hypothetical protein
VKINEKGKTRKYRFDPEASASHCEAEAENSVLRAQYQQRAVGLGCVAPYEATARSTQGPSPSPIERIESLRLALRFRVPLGDGGHELEVLR